MYWHECISINVPAKIYWLECIGVNLLTREHSHEMIILCPYASSIDIGYVVNLRKNAVEIGGLYFNEWNFKNI